MKLKLVILKLFRMLLGYSKVFSEFYSENNRTVLKLLVIIL